MGFNITADKVKVFRKDHISEKGKQWYTYCIGISSKDKDGNYVNMYLPIIFKKDLPQLNNHAEIEIKKSFFVVEKYKDNTILKLLIMDMTVLNEGDVDKPLPPPPSIEDFMSIPDGLDGLPFGEV